MTHASRESTAPPPPAIVRVEAHVLRWPVKSPVQTSFGTMHDRPAVLVRIEDAQGQQGWGEAWCNFPACALQTDVIRLDACSYPVQGIALFHGDITRGNLAGLRLDRSVRHGMADSCTFNRLCSRLCPPHRR